MLKPFLESVILVGESGYCTALFKIAVLAVSEFFENPDKHGYRIFYRSLEEHRKGFMHASLINRLNYETKWLTREQIVHLGYKAIREILIQKGKYNYLPSSIVESTVSKLDDAVVHVA